MDWTRTSTAMSPYAYPRFLHRRRVRTTASVSASGDGHAHTRIVSPARPVGACTGRMGFSNRFTLWEMTLAERVTMSGLHR